jgi:hypothetical protein
MAGSFGSAFYEKIIARQPGRKSRNVRVQDANRRSAGGAFNARSALPALYLSDFAIKWPTRSAQA